MSVVIGIATYRICILAPRPARRGEAVKHGKTVATATHRSRNANRSVNYALYFLWNTTTVK